MPVGWPARFLLGPQSFQASCPRGRHLPLGRPPVYGPGLQEGHREWLTASARGGADSREAVKEKAATIRAAGHPIPGSRGRAERRECARDPGVRSITESDIESARPWGPIADSGAPRIALGSQCLDSQNIQFGVRACHLIGRVAGRLSHLYTHWLLPRGAATYRLAAGCHSPLARAQS